VFGTRNGRANNAENIRSRILTPAVAKANEMLLERGLAAMGRVTPHTLRRTFVSLALIASANDIRWVMAQVCHADHKMTYSVMPSSSATSRASTAARSTRSSAAVCGRGPRSTAAIGSRSAASSAAWLWRLLPGAPLADSSCVDRREARFRFAFRGSEVSDCRQR
jgi:hypothetical protein